MKHPQHGRHVYDFWTTYFFLLLEYPSFRGSWRYRMFPSSAPLSSLLWRRMMTERSRWAVSLALVNDRMTNYISAYISDGSHSSYPSLSYLPPHPPALPVYSFITSPLWIIYHFYTVRNYRGCLWSACRPPLHRRQSWRRAAMAKKPRHSSCERVDSF